MSDKSDESDNFLRIAVSGSSGSGKSTLLKKIVANSEFKDKIYFSVSHTTRKPRIGEKDGKDYYFVSKEQFENMITKNEFIEYAVYNGNLYGTSKKMILQISLKNEENMHNEEKYHQDYQKSNKSLFKNYEHKILILDLERQGVLALKKLNLKFKFVFILCEKNELRKRILKRSVSEKNNLKDIKDLDKRLEEYDHDLELFRSGIYDKCIINHDLKKSYIELTDFLKSNLM